MIIVAQLVKKVFYRIRKFINVSTEVRTGSCPESKESISHSYDLLLSDSFTVLPSTPESSKCSFPSGFRPKLLCIFNLSHACYTPCPSHTFWCDHLSNIWWRLQHMKRSSKRFSESHVSCFLLGPNIHPQIVQAQFSSITGICYLDLIHRRFVF